MADNSLLMVAALEASNPELAKQMDARNTWKDNIAQEGARVALFREYEEGEHRAIMTDQMRKMLRLQDDGTGMTDFTDNYCEVIVSKMADRLSVTNISSGNETTTKWISEIVDRNNWESLQDGIFRSSIVDSDVLVMVDPVTLKWTVEPVYDGYDGILAIYDSDYITPIWACKMWSEASPEAIESQSNEVEMMMVVYQPNSVLYYSGKPGSDKIESRNVVDETQVTDPGNGMGEAEAEAAPANQRAWEIGELPMVRFVNNINLTTGSGRSVLRSVITLQDVLNRTIHSMVMASEFSAFTLLWSIGMEINVSEITPGSVVNLVLRDTNDNVVTEISEEAAAFLAACKVGQFDATPMDQYLNQVKDIAREISHNTSTPIYGVTTEGQISGEAMKQLEVGLLGKVERYQRGNTEAVKRLVRLTAVMGKTLQTQASFQNAFPEDLDTIHVVWKPAEILDVDGKINSLLQLRRQASGLFTDDFYRREIGALLRMRPDQIEEEGKKAQAEADEAMKNGLGADGTIPNAGMVVAKKGVPQRGTVVVKQ